jgi:hypothetical protein
MNFCLFSDTKTKLFHRFVAALCIQWAILMRGFFEMEHGTIKLVDEGSKGKTAWLVNPFINTKQ